MKFIFFKRFYYLDTPISNQLFFQDSSSNLSWELFNLFYIALSIVTMIGIFVFLLIIKIIINYHRYYTNKNYTHESKIEFLWTSSPIILLSTICIPSLSLLYYSDEYIFSEMTVKCVGSQWFWNYEIMELNENINYSSYMINSSDLEKGNLRLLEVDNNLIIPSNTHIRFIINSSDVIHCFSVPSLSIKSDAVPGKLNQAYALINREGKYFGQCSEICGSGHGFMPICIETF